MENLRKVFNIVKDHLLKQGVRATLPSLQGKGCAYRGIKGTKCAVGVLIKDEFYTSELEDSSAGLLSVLEAVEASLEKDGILLSHHEKEKLPSFLRALQTIHDSEQIKDWPFRLDVFETLTFPPTTLA